MRRLILLRHAKSSWATPGQRDHERPLNPRGRSAAELVGRCCAEADLLPDLIRSSDSARTRETVARWSDAAGWSGPVQWSTDLYHAPPHRLLEAARTARESWQRCSLLALVGAWRVTTCPHLEILFTTCKTLTFTEREDRMRRTIETNVYFSGVQKIDDGIR